MMEEEKNEIHPNLKNKIPHNPLGGNKELPKDPLAMAAVDALTFLNKLSTGQNVRMGEVMSQVVILLNFLLQENRKRKDEYKFLKETLNDLKELLENKKKIKGRNYGLQENSIKEKISRWLRGPSN